MAQKGEKERSLTQNGSSVEQRAEMAARKASPWIERLARIGYVVHSVVYVLVGGMVVQARASTVATR